MRSLLAGSPKFGTIVTSTSLTMSSCTETLCSQLSKRHSEMTFINQLISGLIAHHRTVFSLLNPTSSCGHKHPHQQQVTCTSMTTRWTARTRTLSQTRDLSQNSVSNPSLHLPPTSQSSAQRTTIGTQPFWFTGSAMRTATSR